MRALLHHHQRDLLYVVIRLYNLFVCTWMGVGACGLIYLCVYVSVFTALVWQQWFGREKAHV
jgi:hypothetical protein